MKVKINIDSGSILRRRGMGNSDALRRHIASEVKRFSDPYVPYQQGLLKNASIANDGRTITYGAPYAHYHWVGEIYGPNIPLGDEGFFSRGPKSPIGRQMNYHGAPMRGPKWTERAMADRKSDLEQSVKTFIKGRT